MGYIKEKSKKWMRSIGVAFAGLFCVAALVLFQPGEVQAETQGTVTASSANIRSSADTGSTVLASVKSGDKVSITEEVTGTDGKVWYKVFIDANSQGYIRSDLVSTSTTDTTTTTTTTTPANTGATLNTSVTVNMDGVEAVQPVSASVTKDQVRVRADSSTNSSIVTMVNKDIVLTVHGTKPGNGSEVWYQVSFMTDGQEVTGYVRSDFVTLSGELLPVTETPEETPQAPEETTPEVPVEVSKDYETEEIDGVWYLLDHVSEPNLKYQISNLLTSAEQNALDLERAQNQVSKQNKIIIFLAILVVLMVLGITLLIFKIRDMKEEEGFEDEVLMPRRKPSGDGSQRAARPAGNTGRQPVTRPAGSRPASNGTRPAGSRPVSSGTRPAGSRPASNGARPAGSRPASAPSGDRPVSNGEKPASARPASSGETGARPAQARVTETRPTSSQPVGEKQTKPRVKNFMTDDDEFEFEFLNWDGEEEK